MVSGSSFHSLGALLENTVPIGNIETDVGTVRRYRGWDLKLWTETTGTAKQL